MISRANRIFMIIENQNIYYLAVSSLVARGIVYLEKLWTSNILLIWGRATPRGPGLYYYGGERPSGLRTEARKAQGAIGARWKIVRKPYVGFPVSDKNSILYKSSG